MYVKEVDGDGVMMIAARFDDGDDGWWWDSGWSWGEGDGDPWIMVMDECDDNDSDSDDWWWVEGFCILHGDDLIAALL